MNKIIIAAIVVFIITYISYRRIQKYITPIVIGQGVNEETIVVGQSIDLTGVTQASKSYYFGLLTAITKYNRTGGINGKQIVLKTFDDMFDPIKTLENTKLLVGYYNVFCMIGTYGEKCTESVVPYLREPKVQLFSPSTGIMNTRTPFNKYIVNTQSSYMDEISCTLDYMKTKGFKNFSIFYQESTDIIKEVQILLNTRTEFNLILTGLYKDGSRDTYQAYESITGLKSPYNKNEWKNPLLANIDFIIFAGGEEQVKDSIKYFKNLKPSITCIYMSTVNTVYTIDLLFSVMDNIENVYVTTVTNKDPTTSICIEYQNEIDTQGLEKLEPRMSFKSLSGYVAGKYFCELLKSVNVLTRENLMKAVYENKITFDSITFDKFKMGVSNQGTNNVYMYRVIKDGLKYEKVLFK